VPRTAADWQRLSGALAGELRTDEAARASVAADASGLVGTAEGVVRPAGAEDLVALVAWARSTRTPLVARGAGTSLDGESVPLLGGVVIDFSAWDRVLEIDPVDGNARVQPGVGNRALDRALRPFGRTYPVNPGSGATCTLGGNAATNASGPRSYRHGSTRHWIRALEVVDGRGARWTAGGRWAKASVGPDLLGMLVGSEGTLALFSELTVRVALRPERRTGLVVPVPSGVPLGAFVREVADALGPEGSALEYVDRATAAALRTVAGRDWSGDRGLLLAEIEGNDRGEEAALARLEALAGARALPEEIAVFEDADRLWEIRGAAGPALGRDGAPALREDVVVPLTRLDALLAEIPRIAERHAVEVHVFGHIGQGNLHPNFVVDPRSETARRVRAELVDAALRLGGAVSGEHGVGATKPDAMDRQWGAPARALHRRIKETLDPDGILNPGKIWPEASPGPAPPP